MKMNKILYFLTIFIIVSSTSCNNNEESYSFKATIIEINGNSVIVTPLEGEMLLNSADRISFVKPNEIDASIGDIVIVNYEGSIRETYPAQINAVSWSRYITSE